MRVPITKELNLEDLKSILEREHPGLKCTWRGKKVLIVSDPAVSKSAAAQVMAGKKKATIVEAFSTMGGQMLFVFSILFLGILIPFLVYMIAYKPKQTAVCNKVADVVRAHYGATEVV